MKQKILVTYASQTGSSAQVAEAVSNILVDKGAMVVLLPIQRIDNLSKSLSGSSSWQCDPEQAVAAGSFEFHP